MQCPDPSVTEYVKLAVPAVVGHKGDDLRIGIVADRAVDRIAHPRDRQWKSVGIVSLASSAEAGIDNGDIFGCDKAAVVVGYRWRSGDGSKTTSTQ